MLIHQIDNVTDMIEEILQKFESFKNSQKLRKLIIERNDVEEECDKLYPDSMQALINQPDNMLLIMAWRAIYGCFEACADACEHTGECVASVIMKNT